MTRRRATPIALRLPKPHHDFLEWLASTQILGRTFNDTVNHIMRQAIYEQWRAGAFEIVVGEGGKMRIVPAEQRATFNKPAEKRAAKRRVKAKT